MSKQELFFKFFVHPSVASDSLITDIFAGETISTDYPKIWKQTAQQQKKKDISTK